jgi:hypothetical protein
MPFRFLTVGPRVLRTGKRIVIREPTGIGALLFGLFGQHILVDADARTITIERRSFGRKTTRQLLFDHVRAVTYSYVDLNEPYTADFIESAHDSYDHFTVGLRLTDTSEVVLADFVGEGAFRNNTFMPNWAFLHLYFFNLVGTQEQDSRQLVDELSELIGVPVIAGRRW